MDLNCQYAVFEVQNHQNDYKSSNLSAMPIHIRKALMILFDRLQGPKDYLFDACDGN